MTRSMLPRRYDRLIKDQLGLRAVFPPVTPVAIGDIFERDDGIFQRVGNLADFGIPVAAAAPRKSAAIQITSKHVRVTKYDGTGRVSDWTGRMSADGRLELDFRRGFSFFVRSLPAEVTSLKSPALVGRRIAADVPAWKHLQWFLATEVMLTKSVVILGNSSAKRTLKIGGSIKALTKLFDGQLDGTLALSGLSATDLSIRGQCGAVAMRLARVRVGGDLEFK
jgi:hypothetical protein